MHNPDADYLEALATRCEQGARSLHHEARHAAEILPTRAGGNLLDPQQWANDKLRAAATATDYALELRAKARTLREQGRPATPRLLAQAEKVADAANLGGILVDGRTLDDAASHRPFNSQDEVQAAVRNHRDHRDAIESSGQFEHVADAGVPYWRLGKPNSAYEAIDKVHRANQALAARRPASDEPAVHDPDATRTRGAGNHMTL